MHRLLLLVALLGTAAIADPSPPDGGVPAARAQRGQQTVDDVRNRLQTNEQVAANLTPDERLMLLSGIICDAAEQADQARATRRPERAKRPAAESQDGARLHERDAFVTEQQARIAHARHELGRVHPTACNTAAMRSVVRCIRGKSPAGGAGADCDLPAFWKYQRALMDLDSQWRDLFLPRRSRP